RQTRANLQAICHRDRVRPSHLLKEGLVSLIRDRKQRGTAPGAEPGPARRHVRRHNSRHVRAVRDTLRAMSEDSNFRVTYVRPDGWQYATTGRAADEEEAIRSAN